MLFLPVLTVALPQSLTVPRTPSNALNWRCALMLLVVEWYFNDLQHNLQMTVSLEVIFSFLDGNPKFSSQRTTLTSICAVAKAEARMSVSTLESSH